MTGVHQTGASKFCAAASIALFFCAVNAAPVLLGVGGSSSSGGGHAADPFAGASVTLATVDGRSKLHGTSLKLDIENLEVSTSGGLLRLLPKLIEIDYPDGNIWTSAMSPSKFAITHNEKQLVSLATVGGSNSYYLNGGDIKARFLDIVFNETAAQSIDRGLCEAEYTLSASSLAEATAAAATACIGAAVTTDGTAATGTGGGGAAAATGTGGAAAAATGTGSGGGSGSLTHSLGRQSGVISQLARNILETKEKLELLPALDETYNILSSRVDQLALEQPKALSQALQQSEHVNATLAQINQSLSSQISDLAFHVDVTFEEVGHNITELTSNMSQAIARSNSILAKVIGDVNISVTSLGYKVSSTNAEIWENATKFSSSLRDDVFGNLTVIATNITSMNNTLLGLIDFKIQSLNTTVIDDLRRGAERVSGSISVLGTRLNESCALLSNQLQATEQRHNHSLDTVHDTVIALNESLLEHVNTLHQTIWDSNHTLSARASNISTSITLLNDTLSHTASVANTLSQTVLSLNTTLVTINASSVDSFNLLSTSILKLNTTVVNTTEEVRGVLAQHNSSIDTVRVSVRELNSSFVDTVGAINSSIAILNASLNQAIDDQHTEISQSISLLSQSANDSFYSLNQSLSAVQAASAANISQLNQEILTVNMSLLGLLQTTTQRINDSIATVNSTLDAKLNNVNAALSANIAEMAFSLRKNVTEGNAVLKKSVYDFNVSVSANINELRSADEKVVQQSNDIRNAILANMSMLNASIYSYAETLKESNEKLKANVSSHLAGVTQHIHANMSNVQLVLGERLSSHNDSIRHLQVRTDAHDMSLQRLSGNVSEALVHVQYLRDSLNKVVNISEITLPKLMERVAASEVQMKDLQSERLSNSLPKLLETFSSMTSSQLKEVATSNEKLANEFRTISSEFTGITQSDASQSTEIKRLAALVDTKLVPSTTQTEKDLTALRMEVSVISTGGKETHTGLLSTQQEVNALALQHSELKGRFDNHVTSSALALESVKGDVDKKIVAAEQRQKEEVDKRLSEAERKSSESDKKLVQAEAKIVQQTQQLAQTEALLSAYEKRIKMLEEEVVKVRREFATQESVDAVRKLLHDVQTSMVTHSGKVLEVLLTKSK